MGKEKEMTDKKKYPEMLQSDRADEMLDSITITEEELKKRKSKKSSLPTYVRTKKTKPKSETNPLPKDVRKAMDKVYKQDTEARNILRELYDREVTNKPKKKEFMTGGMVNPSYGTEFDDR